MFSTANTLSTVNVGLGNEYLIKNSIFIKTDKQTGKNERSLFIFMVIAQK